MTTASGQTPTPQSSGGKAPEPPRLPLGSPRVYKRLPDRDLRIFVSTPADWVPGDRRPALVFFHGGGWTGGNPSVMNDQAAHYTSKGLVCFLVEYRLIDARATPEVCMTDAKSAMRWVRGHADELGVDPSRIAAAGGSAGAHLSAFTTLMKGFDDPADDLSISPKAQALILYNPVLDNGPGGFGHQRVKERCQEFSPLHNIGPGLPPTVIMSGSADKLVPVKMLKDFQASMQSAGARCDLRIYEGQPHGFYRKAESGGKYYDLTLAETDSFLKSLGWL